MPLILFGRQKQTDLGVFEANLVYTESSWLVKVMHNESLSQNQTCWELTTEDLGLRAPKDRTCVVYLSEYGLSIALNVIFSCSIHWPAYIIFSSQFNSVAQ